MAPKPTDKAQVMINRLRRENSEVDRILTPETATAVKRNVVIPPSTAPGIATKTAANFENIPMMKRKKQQQ